MCLLTSMIILRDYFRHNIDVWSKRVLYLKTLLITELLTRWGKIWDVLPCCDSVLPAGGNRELRWFFLLTDDLCHNAFVRVENLEGSNVPSCETTACNLDVSCSHHTVILEHTWISLCNTVCVCVRECVHVCLWYDFLLVRLFYTGGRYGKKKKKDDTSFQFPQKGPWNFLAIYCRWNSVAKI